MLRLRTVGGRLRTFIVNSSPVLGSKGQYRGVLASFDDVTDLEEKERELRKAVESADAANRTKSEFLANMSHEIRTPMNAILGFTDVLRRGFAADEQTRQHYLDTIHSSGKHLLELINDILDLSKIEAGRLEVERTAVLALRTDLGTGDHVHRARAKPGDLPGVHHGRAGPRDDPHRSDPASGKSSPTSSATRSSSPRAAG